MQQPHSPNSSSNGIVAESLADDHERELIVMLEQKHGKVSVSHCAGGGCWLCVAYGWQIALKCVVLIFCVCWLNNNEIINSCPSL